MLKTKNDKNGQDPQEAIKKRISWLFSSYIQHDVSTDLKDIADYFSFLAGKVNPRGLSIEAQQDLLLPFESIYLLLRDKLKVYPDSILSQIIDITKENHICDIMAVASSMDQEDISRIKFSMAFRSAMDFIPFWGKHFKVILENGEYLEINQSQLFKLKVALNRLSSILAYASTIELVDYDESFYKFKENYNPEIIDKNKLFAFVNILQVQINRNPESDEKLLILEKLKDIETELHRPKVRWGIVITGFFVLFGFMADLKTIEPNIYNEPYALLQKVLVTIHEDGGVQNQPAQLLEHHEEPSHNSESPAKEPHVAIQPKREDEAK